MALIPFNGSEPLIPSLSSQQPRSYNKAGYRLRNGIERCFANHKRFHRTAMRFNCKPDHFLALPDFVSVAMWMACECRFSLVTGPDR